MTLAVGAATRSFAQEINPTGEYKEGLTLNGWKVFPSIFVGAVYDSNFNQSTTGSSTGTDAGTSLRLSPRVTAAYDGGIHKTTLYGVVDARFFNANDIAATAGISHNYEAMRDLVFNFYGNYTRETDIFTSALNFNNNAIGPPASPNINFPVVLNPFGTTPGVNPIAYNQFTGGASVTKKIDQVFVSLRATAFNITFDHPDDIPAPFQTSHDGTSAWITGRVGYRVTPTFYVFAQGDGIFQRFNNSLFDTNGYRVLGGVGSDDAKSLFRGEIYGGYQTQQQQQQDVIGSGIPTDVNSPVFGGRLSYYPTRYWTFIASVDETLGISTQLSPTTPQGVPTRVTTAILQTTYGIARDWSVGARAGYTRSEFIGFDRLDNSWMAGASFNYQIWRNLLLTLDYQYTTTNSNLAFSDFTRSTYTAGLTYKY